MKWAWLEEKAKAWPVYPTARLGFVRGPLRWETRGGGDVYDAFDYNFLMNVKPRNGVALDSRTFAVTHLQKESTFGFLWMDPFCFHVWIQFKKQTPGVPGSERCLYWRFGLGRWDAGDGKYICPTWYGPGLHWD